MYFKKIVKLKICSKNSIAFNSLRNTVSTKAKKLHVFILVLSKTVLCDTVVWFPCTMPVLMGIMRWLSSSSFMVLWLTWPTCGSSPPCMRRPPRANMRSANCCFRYPRSPTEIHCSVFKLNYFNHSHYR